MSLIDIKSTSKNLIEAAQQIQEASAKRQAVFEKVLSHFGVTNLRALPHEKLAQFNETFAKALSEGTDFLAEAGEDALPHGSNVKPAAKKVKPYPTPKDKLRVTSKKTREVGQERSRMFGETCAAPNSRSDLTKQVAQDRADATAGIDVYRKRRKRVDDNAQNVSEEQIDELSRKTLQSYKKKAEKDAYAGKGESHFIKRVRGIGLATDKIRKKKIDEDTLTGSHRTKMHSKNKKDNPKKDSDDKGSKETKHGFFGKAFGNKGKKVNTFVPKKGADEDDSGGCDSKPKPKFGGFGKNKFQKEETSPDFLALRKRSLSYRQSE